MMNDIRINLEGPTAVEPGDEIRGTVHWTLPAAPATVGTRLFWYTAGKGDRDVSVVDESIANGSSASGSAPFAFRLPAGPYSFSGKLISLIWAIESIAEPGGATARVELTVGPDRREARIDTVEAQSVPKSSVV